MIQNLKKIKEKNIEIRIYEQYSKGKLHGTYIKIISGRNVLKIPYNRFRKMIELPILKKIKESLI